MPKSTKSQNEKRAAEKAEQGRILNEALAEMDARRHSTRTAAAQARRQHATSSTAQQKPVVRRSQTSGGPKQNFFGLIYQTLESTINFFQNSIVKMFEGFIGNMMSAFAGLFGFKKPAAKKSAPKQAAEISTASADVSGLDQIGETLVDGAKSMAADYIENNQDQVKGFVKEHADVIIPAVVQGVKAHAEERISQAGEKVKAVFNGAINSAITTAGDVAAKAREKVTGVAQKVSEKASAAYQGAKGMFQKASGWLGGLWGRVTGSTASATTTTSSDNAYAPTTDTPKTTSSVTQIPRLVRAPAAVAASSSSSHAPAPKLEDEAELEVGGLSLD